MGKRKMETLPVEMTDSEKLTKSQLLAKELEAKALLDLEKKDFADKHKIKLTEVEKKIGQLAYELRTGKEERLVECFESPRFGDNMVDIVRDDTGEVVYSRPMTADERQNGLPFDDADRAAAEH